MRNLAAGASVTASGHRDDRFPPERVVDNLTWEYPADGVLDYTLGEIETTPQLGYGKNENVPMAGNAEFSMVSFPFYVPPTYRLLPHMTGGWVRVELAEETPVKLVRLLNTSNAGANDHAAMRYRVELQDADGNAVTEQSGESGRLFDRPFRQAFFIPEAFDQYGP
jgi:hypothetical protein